MARRASELEYTDYDYLSEDEAVYEGFDAGDDDSLEDARKPRWDASADDEADIDAGDDPFEDDCGFEDDHTEEWSDEPDDEEHWLYTEEDDSDSAEGYDSESYVLNGRKYKDPRHFILALYKSDVTRQPKIDEEEQLALARLVRRGMLCDCSVMPEDPQVPEEYSYRLVDKTSKVLRRLHQTDEEKVWVESLTKEEKRKIIAEGRAAQEKLASSFLPLVMSIATAEYNQMEYLDCVQAGNEGLMKAIQYFNPYKGVKFITYATYLIRNEMRDQAKELKKQKSGPTIWENFVPTEDVIDAVRDRMGAHYWMKEITADSEQTADRIRKQIAVMMEQKKLIETSANDFVLGIPESFDSVLHNAEEDESGLIQEAPCMHTAAGSGYELIEKRRRLDPIKGDGKPPKESELSFENFVRHFFRAVIEAKTITPEKLAGFVLREKNSIENKNDALKRFLGKAWVYTEEAAIADLQSLIRTGDLWPEYYQVFQAKSCGWNTRNIQTEGETSSASQADDNVRAEFYDYIDSEHPTESIALILLEGYRPLRQLDIQEDSAFSAEYYGWLCEIIRLAANERLNEFDRNIMEDLAAGRKYEEIQAKYHISANKVSQRKNEIFLSIYDQIIESSNTVNGSAFLKVLKYRYQAHVIGKWEKKMKRRIIGDHYLEKEPFGLRSRGKADRPRPVMESLVNAVHQASENVVMAVNWVQQLHAAITASVRKVTELVSSDAYKEIMERWSKYEGLENLDEMDDFEDMDDEWDETIPLAVEHAADTGASESSTVADETINTGTEPAAKAV